MKTKRAGGAAPAEVAPGVRERILSTATDLFYREGVRAVGIQRVIDEAGIAKASLYAHYASKDGLVAACLRQRGEVARAALERQLERPGLDARGRLLALFDAQVDNAESSDFRGCPFLNASSEIADPDHPAKREIATQRAWLHGLIERLVREAGAASPEQVAGTLVVLFDGAVSSSQIDRTPAAARHARWAAERILDSQLPRRAKTPQRPARHRGRA